MTAARKAPFTAERIKVLKTCPSDLRDEQDLHRRFAACRANREWFRRDGELEDWIAAGCPT